MSNPEISLMRVSSNGNKEKSFKIKLNDINVKRLGSLFSVSYFKSNKIKIKILKKFLKNQKLDLSKEIYLSVIDDSDVSTIWPNSDGTFSELNSWTEYFVNGDPINKNETKNPNVNFASSFSGFKSTFGPNKAQIISSTNNSLNRINTPLPSTSKNASKTNSYTRSFVHATLIDGEWKEKQNV